MPETPVDDLIEARRKPASARNVLQAAVGAHEGDRAPSRQAKGRLVRSAAEDARIGRVIAAQVVEARG